MAHIYVCRLGTEERRGTRSGVVNGGVLLHRAEEGAETKFEDKEETE